MSKTTPGRATIFGVSEAASALFFPFFPDTTGATFDPLVGSTGAALVATALVATPLAAGAFIFAAALATGLAGALAATGALDFTMGLAATGFAATDFAAGLAATFTADVLAAGRLDLSAGFAALGLLLLFFATGLPGPFSNLVWNQSILHLQSSADFFIEQLSYTDIDYLSKIEASQNPNEQFDGNVLMGANRYLPNLPFMVFITNRQKTA